MGNERAPPSDAKPASHFLESLLEALPNPVFVKDDAHRWVLLNEAFCRFMGHPREELLGKSDYDYFPRAEADVFWAKDDAVFASGELNENEESFTDAAGRVHVIITRKTAHVETDGRRYLLGVITDITDRKLMEDELRRSRDDLEQRVRERTAALEEVGRRKNQFLGILSHELRNPLAPILNALHILDRVDPTGEQATASRAVIARQVQHLTCLVDDLLDLTRIARGKVQLHLDRIDLGQTVLGALEDHRALFARRSIRLEAELQDGDAVVYADRTRLVQILGNLLQNAAKFTHSGGTVHVSLERTSDRGVIRVRDTGIGIAREMLGRVFDPFTQADDSLHRSSGGLGLGLALVKGLAELQGGSVEAKSPGPGGGAEFTVALPLVPGAAPAQASPATAAGRGPRRVLVIDDNVDAAETLRMVLELEGDEVEVAHDGVEGLAKARAFRPDLVFCDLGLPELDGYAFARAMRADPVLSSVTLVAVSGYALPDDQRRALEAGFDRHLAKPVPMHELAEVLALLPRGTADARSVSPQSDA